MPKTPVTAAETDRDLRRVVKIEPTAIQEEFAQLPSDLNRWGYLLAEAGEIVDRAALDLKEWDAQERLRIRNTAEEKGMKTPSVDLIDSLVYANERYRKLREAIIQADRIREEVSATVEAVRAKKEMLISLGATMRQEVEAGRELVIRDRRG